MAALELAHVSKVYDDGLSSVYRVNRPLTLNGC